MRKSRDIWMLMLRYINRCTLKYQCRLYRVNGQRHLTFQPWSCWRLLDVIPTRLANSCLSYWSTRLNTLRTGDADLRFYITTVQDWWRKSAFLTCACFPCTIHLIMQYKEPVSEWSCWRMFIETWTHSELTFRHRASSIKDRRFATLQRTLFIYLINKYI